MAWYMGNILSLGTVVTTSEFYRGFGAQVQNYLLFERENTPHLVKINALLIGRSSSLDTAMVLFKRHQK